MLFGVPPCLGLAQTLFRGPPISTGMHPLPMMRLLHPKHLPLLALALWPIEAHADAVMASGLPHCYKVSDHVYRGAQPTSEGWECLAKLGVTTVLDLRPQDEHDTAAEARMVREAGMHYVNIPMVGLTTPAANDIAKAMDLLDDNETVFVHCAKGMDRTGAVIAAYRIHQEQWDNQKALDEARSLGLHWYERGKMRFILGYRPDLPALAERDSVKLAAQPYSSIDSVGVSTIAR